MLIHHVLGDALRVAVLLALVLVAMPLLRRASSATRRLVLALSLGGALVLPLVSAAVPAWRVEAPQAVTSLQAIAIAEPSLPAEAPQGGPSEMKPAAPPSRVASARVETKSLLVGAWAAGAALVLARLIVGLYKTRRIVQRALRARTWSIAVARASRSTGQQVDVRSTGELDTPAVAGVWKPVILVPHDSASWTDERRYAVLLHELAHVRQGDCFAQVVAQLACAVHWFNPLAWLAARRLRVERELAADDAVVASGERASRYAEDLVAIAHAASASREVPMGTLGHAERSLLGDRVAAIVAAGRLRRPPTPAGTAMLVASVGAGVLAVACATPNAVTSSKVTSTAATAPVLVPGSLSGGSSLDPRLQTIAEEELGRAVDQWRPAAATVLVLDSATGEILANAGLSHGVAADVAIGSAYITGSTIKAITLAAALEEHVVTPTDRIDCEQGKWTFQGETFHDAHEAGVLTVPELLAVSSNIGFGKIDIRLGNNRLGKWLRAFHFGEAPAIEGAVAGVMPQGIADQSPDGVMLAIGEKMTASPLQVAAAYGALANGGFYVAPTLTHRTGEAPRERVLTPETTAAVVTMLEGVVSREEATGTRARVEGQRVAGKTGTAMWKLPDGSEHYYMSFVGFVPSAGSHFVILVGVEQPKVEGSDGGGGAVAAPVFARVAARALAH